MKRKNSKSLVLKLLIISIISIINTTHTYAHFLSFGNRDEQYQTPRSKSFFYDKNGLVNVSKKYKSKRLNVETERNLASEKRVTSIPRFVENLYDSFSTIWNTEYMPPADYRHYYDKNGLVNVSRKYKSKRLNAETERLIASDRRVRSSFTIDDNSRNDRFYKRNGLVNVDNKYLNKSAEKQRINSSDNSNFKIANKSALNKEKESIFDRLFKKLELPENNKINITENQEIMNPR